MVKYLEAGKIINTHGVGGCVKLDSWCDSAKVAAALKRVYIKENGEYRQLTVERASPAGRTAIIKLEGCDTLEDALKYKNRILYAAREDIPLGEGDTFIADLIGLPVIDADSGRVYGKITDVSNYGASDVYEIATPSGGSAYIPAVAEFVCRVELDNAVFVRPIEGMFEDPEE